MNTARPKEGYPTLPCHPCPFLGTPHNNKTIPWTNLPSCVMLTLFDLVKFASALNSNSLFRIHTAPPYTSLDIGWERYFFSISRWTETAMCAPSEKMGRGEGSLANCWQVCRFYFFDSFYSWVPEAEKEKGRKKSGKCKKDSRFEKQKIQLELTHRNLFFIIQDFTLSPRLYLPCTWYAANARDQ